MARGRKTGGRQKGSRNRATAEAGAAADATGFLPLDYMLEVMRDLTAADSAVMRWRWPPPPTCMRD
jgi:hypothetical protein